MPPVCLSTKILSAPSTKINKTKPVVENRRAGGRQGRTRPTSRAEPHDGRSNESRGGAQPGRRCAEAAAAPSGWPSLRLRLSQTRWHRADGWKDEVLLELWALLDE